MTTSLDHLPQELLVQIFTHLPAADLISLSSLCRAFNHAINSCSDLMQKFTVTIDDDRSGLEWIPMRQYSRVFVSCDNLSKFLHIFRDIGGSLRSLEMRYCAMAAVDLIEILRACGNVRELRLHVVKLTSTADDLPAELPELSLDRLYLLSLHDSAELVFAILARSSIAELDLFGEFHHPQLLKNLLRSQTSLECFKIHNQCDEYMLFDDESLSDVQFKLRELKLNNWDMYNQLTPFFRNFIALHKDSLETFESNNPKIFNYLPTCAALKTVKLPSMQFTSPNVYESVENLTLEIDADGDWSSRVPNVKNVSLTQTFSVPTDALMAVENCAKLERLEINYGKVCEMNLPVMKEINLRFIKDFQSCPIRVDNLKSLEKIVIERCEHIDWLIDCLESEELRLKLLSIRGGSLNDSVRKVLIKNLGKIERVELIEE